MIHPKNLVQQIVILQLLAVSVFGGQGWKHIPEIPAGRRAQYLLLKRDGGYKYGYDTGEGSSAFQSASADNEVTGNYAYTGGDGLQQGIQYTSGVGGFVPKISPQVTVSGSSAVSGSSVEVSQENNGAVDESSGDSTYNFAFNAGNFQQEEKSDAAHNVVGSYQYTADDGQHNVQYSAAAGTGFLATVDGVQYPGQGVGGSIQKSQGFNYQTKQTVYSPQVPITVTNDLQQATITPYAPIQEESTGDPSYTFSYSSDAHSRDESSDAQGNVQGTYSFVDPTGTQQKVDYMASDKTGFLVKTVSSAAPSGFSKSAVQHSTAGFAARKPSPNYLPAPTSSDYDASGPSDASYSFGYQASDHSRQESSDASGNVIGSYSFVAKDDGVTKTVDYVAGAEKGFVASGAHLPGTVSSQSSSSGSSLTKTFSSPSQIPQQNYIPTVPTVKGVPVTPVSAPTAPDGSYSFSFDAGDHSRSESGDSSGSVQGSYSFITKDDGVRRKVDYSASSTTGFVANVSPSVQSAPSQPSGKTVAPYTPAQTSPPQLNYIPSGPAVGVSSEGTGGSYSFAYDAGDHSRSESGDTSGNVKGSYSFTAKDDGLQRRVDYVAGADTGFLASGAHLPTPVPSQTPLAPAVTSGFAKTSLSFRPQPVPYTPPISPPSGSGIQPGVTDGSYSFTYDAGDHSRTESGDASGSVKGQFSFIAKDDGLRRTADYSAGAGTGFIAAGAHLPSAVPVPHTSVPSTYTATNLQSVPGAATYQTAVGSEDESSGDASYSYSYETDSSSKQETSDSQGNVAGSFTFLGGDGISRTVQYTSKGDEGFVASGDHLPKPGSPIASPPTQLPQITAAGRNSFGINGQSTISSGGYSFNRNSFNSNSIAQGKTAFSGSNKLSDHVIHTYLPPDSEKFGYIYDTKGH